MRKVLGVETGVSVGTQPLSILMEEKMNDKLVPTAVLSMQGKLKRISDDASETSLSSPEEEVLEGLFPVLLGHPESWSSDKEGFQISKTLYKSLSEIHSISYLYPFDSILMDIHIHIHLLH